MISQAVASVLAGYFLGTVVFGRAQFASGIQINKVMFPQLVFQSHFAVQNRHASCIIHPKVKTGSANADCGIRGLNVIGVFGAGAGDKPECAAKGLDRKILSGAAVATHKIFIDHQRGTGAYNQFSSVEKKDLGVAGGDGDLVVFKNCIARRKCAIAARA